MIENLNEMRDRGNRGGSGERTPPVRVKLRPAFEMSPDTMAQVTSEVQSRLATSLAEQGVADSRVSSDGRAMTLEGRVATEHQKALIEKMLSLEPGVSTIENRLVVDPTIASEE
jgi:osmotically-inducible protein OsmY